MSLLSIFTVHHSENRIDRFFAVVFWVVQFVCCFIGPVQAQNDPSDTLAEVEAGSDGNLTLIKPGTFKYRIRTKWRGPKKPPRIDRLVDPALREAAESTYQPERDTEMDMTVYWAGDRVRLDQTAPPDQVERTIIGTDDAVVFTAPWLGTDRQFQSADYVARIKPVSKAGQPLAHPLNQGVPMYSHSDRLTLSSYLRSARSRTLKMDVSRKDELVSIRINDPERFSRREFIVDPLQGYNVVTYRSWSTKQASDDPETVIQTTYVEGPPGAFHMSRLVRTRVMLLQEPDESEPNDKITTELDCQLIQMWRYSRSTHWGCPLVRGLKIPFRGRHITTVWMRVPRLPLTILNGQRAARIRRVASGGGICRQQFS